MRALCLVALMSTACSYGVLTPEDETAPPPASKPPLGEAPPPPEGAPPPPPRNAESGCPGIDAQGQCRGSMAIWCEGGQVRSVDCAAINRACELVDETTGYYCGRPVGGAAPLPEDPPEENPEEDRPVPPGAPLPPPDEGAPPPPEEPEEGAPPPPEAPPPDEAPEPGAPPPPVPQPPDEAPEPPADEGAPPPPADPQDPCGGVTYEGYCEGDVAVWCDGQQVRRADCAVNGQTCGYVDEDTGFYCRDGEAEPGAPAPPAPPPQEAAPPPPDEGAPPPPAGGGCGGIDYLGICEGTVVVFCSNNTLIRHDCGPSGATCGWIDDAIGNWCVEQ